MSPLSLTMACGPYDRFEALRYLVEEGFLGKPVPLDDLFVAIEGA